MSETYVHNGTCLKECSAFETYYTDSLAPFLQFITPFKQDIIKTFYGYDFFSIFICFLMDFIYTMLYLISTPR